MKSLQLKPEDRNLKIFQLEEDLRRMREEYVKVSVQWRELEMKYNRAIAEGELLLKIVKAD